MVIKCQKMDQMSWNLDQVCISGSCIEFMKKFEKFWKLADFWPENGNFLRFSLCDFGTAFSTESLKKSSKMPQSAWFLVYRLLTYSLKKLRLGFLKFWIFTELWLNLWAETSFFRQFWSPTTRHASTSNQKYSTVQQQSCSENVSILNQPTRT